MYNTINITVVDAEDIGVNFIMSKVFSTLHKDYFPTTKGKVGLTFPKICKTGVGDVVCLYSETEIDRKEVRKTLRKFEEYLHIGKNKETITVKYLRKVDTKSKDKLIRRGIKRRGLSEDEAKDAYKDYQSPKCKFPYLVVRSKSNGQKFSMFFTECEKTEKINSYGLCSVSV